MEDDPRRVEPWPLALAALLTAMIGICLAFWWVAATHPDPLVVDDLRALGAPAATATNAAAATPAAAAPQGEQARARLGGGGGAR